MNKKKCEYCGYFADINDTVCDACGSTLTQGRGSFSDNGSNTGYPNNGMNGGFYQPPVGGFNAVNLVDMLKCATVKVTTIGGSGTGFFILYDKSKYLITNHHVIDDCIKTNTPAQVLLPEDINPQGNAYHAIVLDSDPVNDVAILEVMAPIMDKVTTLNLADMSTVKMGDAVCTIGNPRHLEFDYIEGTVSSTKYNEARGIGTSSIICNLNATHGNSGGAVLRKADGKVVGITSAIFNAEYLPSRTVCVSTDAIIQLIYMYRRKKEEFNGYRNNGYNNGGRW